MAIQVEIWQKHIVNALWANNKFIDKCHNADEYVQEGRHVHIPQAGAASAIAEDRVSLPASIGERTDTIVSYTLKEFTTDPVLIRNIDKLQLSYNKRESVVGEDIRNLVNRAALSLLHTWSATAAGNIVRTSGADRPGTAPSATGSRKKFTYLDLLSLKHKFDADDIPDDGNRIFLGPAIFYKDLFESEELLARDYAREADVKNGVITKLLGFNMMQRSTVSRYTEAGTPVLKGITAAGAATDNSAAQAWHPYFVERALGAVTPFESLGKPEYYGDVYSFLVMLGGRQRRSDGKGVYTVVEAAGS